MDKRDLEHLLSDVADGNVAPADALTRIQTAPTADLGFAQLDLSRGVRQGAGEVVYGAGKTAEQIAAIIEALRDTGQERVLVTRLDRLYDVGVAGLHRLLAHAEELARAQVVIAIAGMEGALASVIGGLVSCPVIAVPTSVGYGASFGGVAALLAMLNSCASGVSVVNIDNGFGAAYQASLINHLSAGTPCAR